MYMSCSKCFLHCNHGYAGIFLQCNHNCTGLFLQCIAADSYSSVIDNMSSKQQPSSSVDEPVKTDWSKCLPCQQVTSETLPCPAKSKHSDVSVEQVYSTLSRNIMHFSELNDLPMSIDFRSLDKGNGIEATLLEHEAKWHKSCQC